MNINMGAKISCGIVEVTELDEYIRKKSRAKELIRNLRNDLLGNDGYGDSWSTEDDNDLSDSSAYSLFIWSDYKTTRRTNNGATLASSLTQGKYGEVSITGPRINPNTGHRIWMYVFTPNKKFHDAVGWNANLKVSNEY